MQSLDPLAGQIAVVGSGIAGLITALELAPRPVVLVTRAELGRESSSLWAQGGIAASLGPDDDPDLHLADTLAAGAGLCDQDVARGILSDARDAIATLEHYGVRFDRKPDGTFSLGLEAAHGRRRILHAGGDGSGAAITLALAEAVRRTPSITLLTGVEARRVLTEEGRVTGLLLQTETDAGILPTTQVVLATGGLGGLFDATTNPSGNVGQGVMMAARAGALLADMEFVQFHPTALDVPRTPLPLVSEAVRGEGAWLLNGAGERFMLDTEGAELAPRDVVARAIHAQIEHGQRVYLDASRVLGPRFATAFPTIDRLCREAGIDPARDPIPVRPAAHYHMGGVATDAFGRTSLAGLWAVGECAATGLHGANRLASNSLLEAVVMARRAAKALDETPVHSTKVSIRTTLPRPLPRSDVDAVRPIVSRHLGLIRDKAGLEEAIRRLRPLALGDGPASDPALVALAIAGFAALRLETRGGHARRDFPNLLSNAIRHRMTLDDILAATADLVPAKPHLVSEYMT
ncbi:L-aspartate oxidase [Celeribacter sp. PS-C1]|uniref:L-aspartate oxidase n=1 Tax=Celeribacter sp. PS-C1 TaxID=2820813 RepID=UPI001CA51712|nr:L-aspartate oxidase [Celeribacter sp. PS-C1]MBW6417639.1 L-aspartate oxidase [Celeribacter sp. PS-C1]